MSSADDRPWQLRMFDVSLKKRQKVKLILELLGPLGHERCLLVTNGDNNGAMNFRLREAGGRWRWADLEESALATIEELLHEPVAHAHTSRLPFENEAFDRVVIIDVHEHLQEVEPLNREIVRVLAPGGTVLVTTPNGDTRMPVARLKRGIGMSPAEYGHVVQGYTIDELERMLLAQGLRPIGRGSYSKFFTELAELAINFVYVKVLSRGKAGSEGKSEIAPTSEEKLRRVEKSYRLYRRIHPALRAFSALDRVSPGDAGYAVAVTARKPAEPETAG